MKIKRQKKGFTIVELVIVIAVIAVLSAILIPTFAGLVRKAKVASDTALVKDLNTALSIDKSLNGKNVTMHDALEATKESGLDVSKLNAKIAKNEIMWDSANDVFCYLDDGKIKYVPDTNLEVKAKDVKAYQYFVIRDVKAQSDISADYSTYLRSSTLTEVSTTKGLDAGEVETITTITYTNTSDAQEVVIRTNSANTNLTINAASDTVNHYGNVGKVDVQKVDVDCYNEHGTAAYVKVTEGKVVAKAGGKISVVFTNNTDATKAYVIKDNGGNIEEGYTLATVSGSSNIALTQKTETEVENIAKDAISDLLDSEVSESVVRAVTSTTTEYYSFKNFAKKVNNGTLETKGVTFTLMANVDLNNEEWEPIGTSEHPFSGIFDGNGFTVKNFKISSSKAKGEDGLFGFVVGDLNMEAINMANRWNSTSYSFDTSNVESLYTAVVKNLTVSGATISSPHAGNTTDEDVYGDYGVKTNRKSTAAAIGLLRCAYAEYIIVDNSTVNGYKTVGGVIGSLDGGSIAHCSTTNTVVINGYSNIGGIVGGLENANSNSSSERKKHSIIANCENNATINKLTTDKAYGYIGGIIGTAQNDICAVVDCTVNGVISSKNEGTDAKDLGGAVGGVVGQTCSGGYFINCTNNATMNIVGSHGYVGGITEYAGTSKLINCVNNSNITANAIQLAGIVAGASGTLTYVSCVNNGVLTNTKDANAVFDISSINGVAEIKDATFATVSDLQTALENQSISICTNIKLINVTVTDTNGALIIPNSIESISSDKKVCSTFVLSQDRTRSLSVKLPGITYTYDGSYVLWMTCDNSVITVPENVTISSLSVSGENTSVIIRGTVTGTVSVKNVSTVDNYGTIGSINISGTKDITFNNYGTVTGISGSAKHSVYTVSKVNLTINNHGSIKAGEGGYALLFYGNSTVVLNAYAGSTITKSSTLGVLAISNGPVSHAKLMTINVEEGADGVSNNRYYGLSPFTTSTYECTLVINFNADL